MMIYEYSGMYFEVTPPPIWGGAISKCRCTRTCADQRRGQASPHVRGGHDCYRLCMYENLVFIPIRIQGDAQQKFGV